MIVLMIRLLQAGTNFAHALTEFIYAAAALALLATAGDFESVKGWLRGAPQAQELHAQSPLTAEEQALFMEFQQYMDKRYQMDTLSRHVLTLPALPGEGY